jgi:predicted RNase H-like nuclease
VAVATDNRRFWEARLFRDFAALLGEFRAARVIGVDIPIGLPAPGRRRRADEEARRFVGPRGGSVFPTPSRGLLEGEFRAGLGVSRQSHSLGVRILEVERAAGADHRVVEVHPEVSFRAMAGEHLRYSKRTWNGLVERRRLLAEQGLMVPGADLGEAGRAAPDDVLDAAAAAWSAHRKAVGEARSLPEEPELIDGRLVAIWY